MYTSSYHSFLNLGRKLSILIIITILFSFFHPIPGYAAIDYQCGKNATWSYENGVLTISGTGRMYDYSNGTGTPWYAGLSFYSWKYINKIIVQEGITYIGKYSFALIDKNLSTVSLPSTLKEIGEYAFYDDSTLDAIQIPNNVTKIGKSAFRNCGLKLIVLPASISTIENFAFDSTGKLTDIYYAGNSTLWDSIVCNKEFNKYLSSAELHTNYIAEWNAPIYSWSFNNASVTAIRTSKISDDLNETETVLATSKITKDPTCETMGETTYSASFTNSAFKAQSKTVENINALGHTIVVDPRINATYIESGLTEGSHCSVCKKILTAQKTIPSLCQNILRLPSGIVSVEENAFTGINCDAIVIPESCKIIHAMAFANCKQLKYVRLSKHTEIEDDAFSGVPASVFFDRVY